MNRFVRHTGTVLPLRRTDVDTDQIIPAEYLKRVTRTGFEDGLFAAWRNDPDFVLNDPAFAGASILVAGHDFGVGSSREHAVWALLDYGFVAVLAPRFGDIFRGNAGKAGLLAAEVDPVVVRRLWDIAEARPQTPVTVDLEARRVRVEAGGAGEDPVVGEGLDAVFDIDDYTRWRLLEGLDDIAISLAHEAEIAAYESSRPSFRPVTTTRSDRG